MKVADTNTKALSIIRASTRIATLFAPVTSLLQIRSMAMIVFSSGMRASCQLSSALMVSRAITSIALGRNRTVGYRIGFCSHY